jgi:hypothetical protein
VGKSYLLWFFFSLLSLCAYAQQGEIEGFVTGSTGLPLQGATVSLPDQLRTLSTDSIGYFRVSLAAPDTILLRISYIGYKPYVQRIPLAAGELKRLTIQLKEEGRLLKEVAVQQDRQQEILREQSSVSRIAPEQIQHLTSPFGDISAVLATLPGVNQNNELSSSYAVRGGNFDENLVYVNEIPVYRPFLLRAGQQEGLSFVNPSMVQSLQFSAGGWQAKWGDKLSSVLNIKYKEPDSAAGSVTAGLLGGQAHLEGVSGNKKLSWVAGARHKSARYLLNTLDTEGEYLPRFTDFQAFFTYRINDRTSLNLLSSFARNRYLVVPIGRQTNFGTVQESYQLNVGFEGQELLYYDMGQNALKLNRQWSKSLQSSFIASYLHTVEREYADVEGGYRLCNIDKDPDSETFNECISVLGIGTDYQNIRNRLQAGILNLQLRNEWRFSRRQLLEFGFQWGQEQIRDRLREWSFRDSADFVQINSRQLITNDIALLNHRLEAYVQNTSYLGIGKTHTLHYGLRLHHFSLNRQWLFSPRLQYAFRPAWKKDVVFTAATGFYHQPPLYREFRNLSGEIVPGVLAQQSWHVISGVDMNFRMWDRVFNFVSEVYYKKLWDVNPYEVDNVRIRYFASNEAIAYATGADFRLSGEFIPGAESWFSLGLLKTAENIAGDEQGFIPRPSDQRVNLAVYFQDHIPDDPSLRVYLKLLYGSGIPFGPPGRPEYRNQFSARSYRRVDIGFSKIVQLQALQVKSLWIGLEVLNLLGNNNIISYNWIRDFNNNQYAVPNTLSNRFFNLKLTAQW